MQASSRIKTAFNEGRPTIGMWQMLPGANVSRLLARSGADWVLVDCEHGNIDDGAMHDAVPAIAAVGASPIVRIADTKPWMIKRALDSGALDSGAHGILVPLIRTPEEAREVVRAAKFPGMGERGFGSSFALERLNPMPTLSEYLEQANDAILTILQIETREALEVVDEIAAVDGVDALFIGPFDLGNNIGHPIREGVMDQELKDAIARTLSATKKAGKKSGIFTSSAQQAKLYADQGYDMVVAATDYTTMRFSLREAMDTSKGTAGAVKGGLF